MLKINKHHQNKVFVYSPEIASFSFYVPNPIVLVTIQNTFWPCFPAL